METAMPQVLTRALLLAASAAVLTACATAPTPRYPVVEGGQRGEGLQPVEMPRPAYPTRREGDSQSAPDLYDNPDADPAPEPAPSQSVEVASLAPVAAPGRIEVAQLQAPPQEEAEPEPEYVAPPPPRTETRTVTSVSGKVVDVGGKPKTHTVKSGQGLDAVARELGTTRKQLAADNNLKEPYLLKPGQVLKGPASKGKAYVVGSGDTLYAIARRFGVSAKALADENDMALDDPIRSGQKLRLPTGYKDSGPVKKTVTVTVQDPAPPPVRPAPRPAPPVVTSPPPETRPAPPPATTPPVTRPAPPVSRPPETKPATPPATKPQPRPPVIKPATPPVTRPPTTVPVTPPPATRPPPLQEDRPPTYTDADYARMAAGRFDWPVRGSVLSGYGPTGPSQRNDGVDIGAPAGTPVRAAADGMVVYSGGDVPTFGVTVLIQHADGWVTVYGHLQRADVKMQQRVTKGQQIGLVGKSGDAPRPQLHFEVRHSPSPRFKAKAIDPQLVLPR
jgi:murein DD-endopeptidase MepM/ murein hydrolase activator NlpD